MLTHMPFLMYDLLGQRVLFFTQSEESSSSRWKLFYLLNDGEPQRLITGLPESGTECSPTAWQDETGWHISFVAMDENGICRLYRMDGKTFDSLSQPVSLRIARSGFVYKDRIAVGEIQDIVHVHDTNGDHKIEIPGAFLYRIAYRADEPDKILISGDWVGENEDPFTLEYDLRDDTQRYIECNGQGAYKCTIYGDEMLYAERHGKHFEDRRIRKAKKVQGICCQMAHRHRDGMSAALLNVTKKCGCRRNERDKQEENPARPSCLECVEKHLGAAFVIASEIHDGYSYRLRLIGHLHEAEDESQEFLQLHESIRQARKDYQINSTIPDWEALARTVNELRTNRDTV
ncbi:hypothetical protein FACS189419_06840 [Planctomycetales bacterium]|nr:hypothetical protein FACS189419_06840 [Planctomycetales bacterium]